MARVRSRNRTSDKGKIHFYKGRIPTQHEIDIKDDQEQALFVDEVQQASSEKMRIVITWIPKGQRSRFRKSMNVFDPKLKSRGEVKYANTSPEERIDFYEDVLKQDFNVYDSVSMDIPYNVVEIVGKRQGHFSGYWESRYLYQLEAVIRQAVADHTGYIDLVMDKPPLDIIEEIRLMCNRIIGEGYQIRWVTISPSRHVTELQSHDMIAGLDYDISTGWVQRDKSVLNMTTDRRKRYDAIIERLKSKLRSR